jgi:polysaccharide biosynthesis protein PslH
MSGPTTRPRLLFLCHTLPYPPDGGPWIRTFHVLRLLAQAFDITALCFERAGARSGFHAGEAVSSLETLRGLADIEVFPVPQRHSRLRYLWDHARSAASGRVYTRYLYDSTAFRRRLDDALSSTRFDLVHVDSLDLAGYLPACRGLPVVCVHHDIESTLLQRRGCIDQTLWRRAYLRYQARLMRRVERRWCGRIALNVVCSAHDARLLKRIAPAASVAVVPNGVDVSEFQSGTGTGRGVAFVGGTSPFPNADALRFFCEQILPHLRSADGTVPVRWIGRASAREQQDFRERYGVDLTGYLADARPAMEDAACHVVPIRAGGGTRLKILNAWSMGKAVVSTSVGCEGLAAVDGSNILIRDDPRAFAEAILAVLGDAELRARLGARGRATVEEIYSWDVIGRNMLDTYLSVINGTFEHRRLDGSTFVPELHGVRG